MAILCPSDITKLELNNEHPGEMHTLKLLKESLPSSVHVFHGMHWSNERTGYTIYGEIDFVIVDRSGKVVIVEQKNGGLEQEADGELVKRYGNYRKSIAKQIHRMRENLLEKYQQQHRGRTLKMDYLFYCPDHKVANVAGSAIDYKRIVDSSKRHDLPAIIKDLIDPDARSTKEGKGVLDFFYNVYDLVPDVGTYKTHQRSNFVRLSSDMMRFVEKLEMTPYKLHVQGTAGSGKSLLAMRMYQKWMGEGKRVLLTCFNNALQHRFTTTLPESENIKTFHKLCSDALKAHGVGVDFSQSNEDGFWQKMIERVIALNLSDDDKYDALIVDEGQDIGPEWFEILRLFIKDDAPILWLDDPSQQIYKKDPAPLDDFVHFYADINFRTPHSIANYVRDKLGMTFESRNALPGLGVHVESVDDNKELESKVAHRIKELRRTGFAEEDIVVLSCKGAERASFAKKDHLSGIALRKFLNTYDDKGNPEYSDGQVLFDTVYRFKGQQAPAIILTDLSMGMPLSDFDKRLLFVGMTRATVRLEIIIDDNDALERLLSI